MLLPQICEYMLLDRRASSFSGKKMNCNYHARLSTWSTLLFPFLLLPVARSLASQYLWANYLQHLETAGPTQTQRERDRTKETKRRTDRSTKQRREQQPTRTTHREDRKTTKRAEDGRYYAECIKKVVRLTLVTGAQGGGACT